jgi:hypothetical protein
VEVNDEKDFIVQQRERGTVAQKRYQHEIQHDTKNTIEDLMMIAAAGGISKSKEAPPHPPLPAHTQLTTVAARARFPGMLVGRL